MADEKVLTINLQGGDGSEGIPQKSIHDILPAGMSDQQFSSLLEKMTKKFSSVGLTGAELEKSVAAWGKFYKNQGWGRTLPSYVTQVGGTPTPFGWGRNGPGGFKGGPSMGGGGGGLPPLPPPGNPPGPNFNLNNLLNQWNQRGKGRPRVGAGGRFGKKQAQAAFGKSSLSSAKVQAILNKSSKDASLLSRSFSVVNKTVLGLATVTGTSIAALGLFTKSVSLASSTIDNLFEKFGPFSQIVNLSKAQQGISRILDQIDNAKFAGREMSELVNSQTGLQHEIREFQRHMIETYGPQFAKLVNFTAKIIDKLDGFINVDLENTRTASARETQEIMRRKSVAQVMAMGQKEMVELLRDIRADLQKEDALPIDEFFRSNLRELIVGDGGGPGRGGWSDPKF